MKIRKASFSAVFFMTATMLSLSAGFVLAAPLTPEMAAKVQVTRKQESQRITQDKKTAAAEALKAERVKVYQARQAVKQSAPQGIAK
jgi:hypothetical protein